MLQPFTNARVRDAAMSKQKPSSSPPCLDPPDSLADAERRRYGRITRDERGHAVVDWVKPPKDWTRTKLSLVEEPPAAAAMPQPSRGYDPYESSHTGNAGSWSSRPSQLKRPARKDLRKLSEHIKQMRALKEREDG